MPPGTTAELHPADVAESGDFKASNGPRGLACRNKPAYSHGHTVKKFRGLRAAAGCCGLYWEAKNNKVLKTGLSFKCRDRISQEIRFNTEGAINFS